MEGKLAQLDDLCSREPALSPGDLDGLKRGEGLIDALCMQIHEQVDEIKVRVAS